MGGKLAASLIATLRHRLPRHVTANSISSCRTLNPPTVHTIQSYLVKSPYSTKQQPRLTQKDYTVGWVCALSIELAAAQEMLDEEHEGLPQELDDPNIYTLGRIGEHNIVIACLPAGQTGTNSAAVVAVQMKTRFNAIRFGLMVGIGGGVPSTVHDVRLGDVVVSQPYMEHGGVVQYDFGKTTPNGFVRTGFLNAPPTILLNAVASLQAKHLRRRGTLLSHLSKLSGLPAFARDDTGPDDLFEATYKHVGGAACERCSKDRIITRHSRSSQETMVHYGTIASGNQVMRDGVVRDKVSLALGGVLCFEMEAAGLMNSFPCLVIRGICDYADSHKNKRWQAYAAGTAAACAKEVLSVIPATTLVMEPTAEEVMGGMNTSRKACWTVPFKRNPQFVGHHFYLNQLEKTLFAQDRPPTLAITGLGGIGKTQIALELAYRIREKYPECSIFWMPATNTESLQQAYLDVGQQLGIRGLQEEQADVKKLVQRYLSQESAGQWLLIFDNADDMDMWINKGRNKSEFHGLKDYLPTSLQGCVIFTTRSRKIAVKLAQSNVIEVSGMDEEVATQLLSKSLINQELLTNHQNTQKLLQQLTFLPLAIVQAAAYINENRITLLDYLSLLEEQEQDVVELLSEDFEDEWRYQDVKNPVATTWLISFEHIRRLDPLAAEYLSFMSCVNPKGIPQSLLPPAKSRKAEIDAIGTLDAYSFVSRQSTGQLLDLHQLVHLATRNWLLKEDSFAKWEVKAIARLEKVFPNNDHANRDIWRAYLPHVQYILGFTSRVEGTDQGLELCEKFGLCLLSDGRYNEAKTPLLHVMERREKALGPKHPDTLTSMSNLALVLQYQGKSEETEAMNWRVLEGREKVLGPEHPHTLASVNNLAMVLRYQGKYEETEAMSRRALEGYEKVLGPEHPDTLTSVSNLASVLWRQGKYEETEAVNRQALKGREKVLGPEHPDTLTSVSNLASVLLRQGKYEAAEKISWQALEGREKVLGPEHPDTLTSVSILALVLENQGKYEAAEEMSRRALEGYKKVLGPEHPDTLTSVSILALVLENQGKYEAAEEMSRRALEGYKKVLGPEHPDTLTSVSFLASVLENQGKYEETEAMSRRALEGREKVLGPEHPDTLTSVIILALVLLRQGKYEAAEKMSRRALEGYKKVLGPEHPDTLTSVSILASVLERQGKYEETEAMHRRALGGSGGLQY